MSSRLLLPDKYSFPDDFVWGTGTSAYQIEGAWNQDGKSPSIWDHWAHHSGRVKSGHTGDVACDHYRRYKDDVALMKKLNIDAYRFSIAWPRVQPDGRGQLNEKGMDFYDRLIDELLQAGIDPYITLYHWDLPQVLQEQFGGWASRDVLSYFADYAGKMVERFGDRVSMWTTHNEPWCTAYFGYAWGTWAPGVADEKIGKQVHHNLLVSHGLATQAMRAAAPQPIKVGIVLSLSNHEPLTEQDTDLAQAATDGQDALWFDPLYRGTYPEKFISELSDFQENDLKIINQDLDYLGVNFYFRIVHSRTQPIHPIKGSEYTAFGWEVTPEALRRLLGHITDKYDAPNLYITENGAAFDDSVRRGQVRDTRRKAYLREHIEQTALAIQDGANVKGYFAWSLLDNFEWNEGYTKRFGIVHVDFKSQRRIIKASGKWYSRLAKSNTIRLPQQQSHPEK
ncbi:MAG: GH1 family beta-glucosidase [Candidatus Obscuribacterales bacterium]